MIHTHSIKSVVRERSQRIAGPSGIVINLLDPSPYNNPAISRGEEHQCSEPAITATPSTHRISYGVQGPNREIDLNTSRPSERELHETI